MGKSKFHRSKKASGSSQLEAESNKSTSLSPSVASSIRRISFHSNLQTSAKLRQLHIKPHQVHDVVAVALSISPHKGRMVARSLVRNASGLSTYNEIIAGVRRSGKPRVRREVVKAFKDSRRQMELITGLSLMTKGDATTFFRDYFQVGGKLSDVSKWLAAMSERYVEKRRSGKIQPEYDGFWDDLWNGIVDAGKAIGEAITTVVDAVIAAGKTFAEVVEDIINYTQLRFNAIVTALLDAGKEVGEFIAGAIAGAANVVLETLMKVSKAIIAAGRTVGELLQALYDHAAAWLHDGVRILLDIGVRIKDLLTEAMNLALEKLSDIVGFLIDLGHSVRYITRWVLEKSSEAIQTVFTKILEMGKTLTDLVISVTRRSFDLVVKGFNVLLQMGKTIVEITATLISDPNTSYSKALKALMDLGGTFYEFFEAAHNLGTKYVERVYLGLKTLGVDLQDIIKFAAEKGFEVFKPIVMWLIEARIKVLEDLIFAAGFEYDSKQKIFYSRIDSWQKNLGYFTLYDVSAPLLGMIIDCEPILFKYDNRSWKIEFWKGQYGICVGAEIGVYTGEFQIRTGADVIDHTLNKIEFGSDTQTASGDDMLQMSFTLRKGSKVLFTRNSDKPETTDVIEKHWWLTGFKPMEVANRSELLMELSIVLKDNAMRDAFVEGLKTVGYSESTDFSIVGKTVNVLFGVPHTPQPFPA